MPYDDASALILVSLLGLLGLQRAKTGEETRQCFTSKLAVNKVKVSAAQSFCKVIDCKSLVIPIQSWKQGEKDNFLIITRWLCMNRTFIILNQILLSTKALNCNFES